MRIFVLVLSFVFLEGCKSGVETADNAKKVAKDDGQPNGESPDKGGDPASKLLDQMAEIEKEAQALKPIDPVPFQKLLPFLPAAPKGYTGEEPQGTTIDLGEFKHSQAERSYRKGDHHLSITIQDTAHIPELYRGFATTRLHVKKIDSTTGHARTFANGNDIGLENYTKANQAGELVILVGKRFLITVRGDGIQPEFLHTIYKTIDRQKLLELK